MPDGPNKAIVTSDGSIVLAASDHIDSWLRDANTGNYVASTVSEAAPSDLSSPVPELVYFTDATGVQALHRNANGSISVD